MCAFDNKRYILDDGIYTLAYGHKDIPNRIEINKIDDPAREKVITELEARRVGLLWKRSKAIATRLGYDPTKRVEETDEEAIEAGKRMLDGIRNLISVVPQNPDMCIPQVRKPHKRPHSLKEISLSSAPLKRVRLPSDSVEESEILSPATLSTAIEIPVTIPKPALLSTLENLENVKRTASFSNHKHRRKYTRCQKSNPFIISEAEESRDDDTNSTSSTFSKDKSSSDSDSNSDSDSDSDDCILVDNNSFE